MRKMHYPDDRTELEKDFLKCFDGYELQKFWKPLRSKLISWSNSAEKTILYPTEISKLILARYDVLVKVYMDYLFIKNLHGRKKVFKETETKLKQLFSYTKENGSEMPAFQPMLADFFYETCRRIGIACVSLLRNCIY